jgi:hypothetical protein
MEIQEQEEFEKKIMEMLLNSPHPMAKLLINQYEHSKIKSRNYSGAGFFTYFKVNDGIKEAPKQSFEIGGVYADIGDVNDAMGFMLFIRNGFIDWLEGYTLTIDYWPDSYKDVVELKYNDERGITDYSDKF